jgi:hypothetical protein
MNRKITPSIALITIIALAITGGFCFYQTVTQQNKISELQNQNIELQTQNIELQEQNSQLQNHLIDLENMIDAARDVKITGFEWRGDYHHLGQVNLFQAFKVTIQNMGSNNASGLTLSVELLSSGLNRKINDYTTQIGFIRAGETREVVGDVSVGVIDNYTSNAVGVITLSLGDVPLDKWTRNLSGSF